MKGKMKTRGWILPGLVTLITLFILWVFFPSPQLDPDFWRKTNSFYMVYDMAKDPDEADELSRFKMFRISRKRLRMAHKMDKDKALIGLSKKEIGELLGQGSTWYTTKEYANTRQYVLDAEKRMFQFYGESGFVYAWFIIWFDENDKAVRTAVVPPTP